jgi:excisionase family DNA binding protein
MTEATTSAEAPEYMKVSEVAARLNVSERHVYDLIASRELESFRFGDKESRLGLRVSRESLARFEAERRETSP